VSIARYEDGRFAARQRPAGRLQGAQGPADILDEQTSPTSHETISQDPDPDERPVVRAQVKNLAQW
jgi:hypothetical protein